MGAEMVRLLAALLASTLLSATACESDPGRDTDTPGSRVPLDPVRPEPADTTGALVLAQSLGGKYIASLEISGGAWSNIGPRDLIEITLKGSGLAGIGQFDAVVTPEPPVAFDLGLSQFVPQPPFVTLGSGIERSGEHGVRFIGVNFARDTHGAAVLGTLRLRAPSDFAAGTAVRLALTFFSIGPSSTERDSYTAEQLRLGVTVNGK